MVRRPAKKWFKRCVKSVEKSGGADNPEAVCASNWYGKTESERRTIVRSEEKSKRKIKR